MVGGGGWEEVEQSLFSAIRWITLCSSLERSKNFEIDTPPQKRVSEKKEGPKKKDRVLLTLRVSRPLKSFPSKQFIMHAPLQLNFFQLIQSLAHFKL